MKSFNVNTQSSTAPSLLEILNHSTVNLTADSDAVLLTPDNGNIHELHPILAPVAFLDILFPPYDDEENSGQYYKQVSLLNATNLPEYRSYNLGNVNSSNGVIVEDPEGAFLEEIPPPDDYWCDMIPYQGPQLPEGYIEKELSLNGL